MAISRKAITPFVVTTGAVGTTFDVTGLTGINTSSKFAAILWWSGRATVGFGEAAYRFGVGLLTGTASRRSYTAWSDHAVGTTATAVVRHDDCCISTIASAGTLDGKADLDSVITDGLRFIVDDQFTNAVIVGGLVWWGSDLQEAGIVDFDSPAGTGDQDLNFGFALDTGIDDKALFTTSSRAGAFGTIAAAGSFGIGVAAGHSIAQAALGMRETSSNPTANAKSACRSGLCINGSATAGQITHRASATTWLSNGARINWAETATGWNSSALAVKGGRYKVGDILSQTGTSDTDETVGIVPKAILAFSGCGAESASDTIDSHAQISIGGASGPTERSVAFIAEQDLLETTDIGVGFQDDAFYGRVDVTNATKAVIGLVDLVDFDASGGGFTYKNTDADPDQAFIPYLAIGETPGITHTADRVEAMSAADVSTGTVPGTGRASLIGGKLTSSVLLGGLAR